jgi:hypothetical protein
MKLTIRDQEILEYIKTQGVVIFSQINHEFFSGSDTCSRRLRKLNLYGFIETKPLKFYLAEGSNSRYLPYLVHMSLNPDSKIYSLPLNVRKKLPEYDTVFKKSILLHQLHLGEVRAFYSKVLPHDQVLSEYELKTFSKLLVGRNKDLEPDLSLEGTKTKIAIELERTKKQKSRYYAKFYDFYDSTYTHVIYVFFNLKSLTTVMNYTRIYRKIGFSLIDSLDQIYSPTFGKMPLSEWVKKIQSLQER